VPYISKLRRSSSGLGSGSGHWTPPQISSGDARSSAEDEESSRTEHKVKRFRQGDVFGEECLVRPGSLARMSIRAVTQCETCSLSAQNYASLIDLYPDFKKFIEKRSESNLSGFSRLSLCAFLAVGCPLFADADLELIEAVADAVTVIECTAGQPLIRRGTASPGLFLVHSGACDCLIPDPEAPTTLKCVATKLPGSCFGELSLLEQNAKTAADVVGSRTSSVGGKDKEHTAVVLLLSPDSFRSISITHEKFKGMLLATMPNYDEYNFFYHMAIFHDAKHELLLSLVRSATHESHQADEIIQKLGEPSRGAFFVKRGQLLATAPDAKPEAIGEGDHFGLETLAELPLDGEVSEGSQPLQQVQAGTDVELVFLPAKEAAILMSTFPLLKDVCQQRRIDLAPSGVMIPSAVVDISGTVSGGGVASPAAADMLSQRLALLQASIVASSRDMRSQLETLDKGVYEYMDRRTRQLQMSIDSISSRMDTMAQNMEGPQRAARAQKVAFAPRPTMLGAGAGSQGGSQVTEAATRTSLRSSDGTFDPRALIVSRRQSLAAGAGGRRGSTADSFGALH
jgi:CRP-like cAMP-binding protein